MVIEDDSDDIHGGGDDDGDELLPDLDIFHPVHVDKQQESPTFLIRWRRFLYVIVWYSISLITSDLLRTHQQAQTIYSQNIKTNETQLIL